MEYKGLNKSIIKNKYSFLIFDEFVDQLVANIQIRIKKCDIEKTIFCSHFGHYNIW